MGRPSSTPRHAMATAKKKVVALFEKMRRRPEAVRCGTDGHSKIPILFWKCCTVLHPIGQPWQCPMMVRVDLGSGQTKTMELN